jgi:hypothetical protein
MIPLLFRDQADYETYQRCKKTIRVGDKVQVFLITGGFFAYRYNDIDIHHISEPIEVIDFFKSSEYVKVPVIGAATQVYRSMYLCSGYDYIFRLLDTDIRVARIIRGKRQ